MLTPTIVWLLLARVVTTQQATDLIKEDNQHLLLLSTLDGSFICVEQTTGHVRWSLKEEPVVRVPTPEGTAVAPVFLPDPKDGSLYMMGSSEREALTKLPFTIPQLVASAPCRSSDGILYTGKKVDTWFTVNPSTGMKKQFLTHNAMDTTCPREGPDAIFIGRTEYNIIMLDTHKKEKSWNVTFYDYSSYSMDSEMVQAYGYVHFTGSSSGRVLSLQRDTGSLMWQNKHDSPVIAMYLLDKKGLLNVPFTSIAESTLDHLIDEVTMRQSSQFAIEFKADELKLFPTLYVGQHIHGLYALPSLVDQNTATITLAHMGPLLLEGPTDLPTNTQHTDTGKFKIINKKVHNVKQKEEPEHREGEKSLKVRILPGHYKVPSYSESRLQITSKPDRRVIENETYPDERKRPNSVAVQTEDELGREPAKLEVTQAYDILADFFAGNFSFEKFTLLFTISYNTANKMIYKQENLEMKAFMGFVCLLVIIVGMYLNKQVRDIQQLSQTSRLSDTSTGSSHITALPEDIGLGVIQIGKIRFNVDEILGKGCEGTFVFKGEFDGRAVAVKRLLPECFTFADREVDLLRESDEHANVVRYFCTEQDKQFRYIALELCAATLQDYVVGSYTTDKIDALEILYQATCGLQHLHSLHIVHRDIKPHNVLLSMQNAYGQVRAMISDFGLCKKLKLGRASFSRRSGITGTEGWIAPEMLGGESRTTRSVDIFSLGCVYYYVLTKGTHPFGDTLHRQANILNGEHNFTQLPDNPLVTLLVKKMIELKASERPTANAVLKHPIFWNEVKTLMFFQDVSDRIEKEEADSLVLKYLEENSNAVVKGDWRAHIDPEVAQDLRKFRNYRGNSVRDLLRALRNKKHHYRELPVEAQKNLGEIPLNFVQYWTKRFPLLLIHSWLALQCVKTEPIFSGYYDEQYTFPQLPKHNSPFHKPIVEGFFVDQSPSRKFIHRERSPRPPVMRREPSPNPSPNWRLKPGDIVEDNWRMGERRLSEPRTVGFDLTNGDKNPWFEQWVTSDFRDDNAYIKWQESEFYKNLHFHRGEREMTPPFVPEFPARDMCERLRQQRRSLDEQQNFTFEVPRNQNQKNRHKKYTMKKNNKKVEEQPVVWSLPQ